MKARGNPVQIKNGLSLPLKQIKIGEEGHFNERWLQELIRDHPTLLPMSQVEPGLSQLHSVCLELPLRCGFLDNLFMTPEGDLVVAEVKLWKNPEMRRAVLAQTLDYAAALFDLTYDELEAAVNQAEVDSRCSLYERINCSDTIPEAEFVDAVCRNLRTGRIVVLVVGDGIREELETLSASLQSHAGFRFTFALVELSVFENADADLFVVPRTLLKTHRVERGVVLIDDQRTTLRPHTDPSKPSLKQPETLSSDRFMESMSNLDPTLPNRLRRLIDALEPLGVLAEYKKSLILRWYGPSGTDSNIGYILRNGQVWTDQTSASVEDVDSVSGYLESLARSFGYKVEEMSGRTVIRHHGQAPKITEMVDDIEAWKTAVQALRN